MKNLIDLLHKILKTMPQYRSQIELTQELQKAIELLESKDVELTVNQYNSFPEWMGEYPRKSAPWSEQEDMALKRHFDSEVPFEEIAKIHGRSDGDISNRLSRKFGIALGQTITFGRAVRDKSRSDYWIVTGRDTVAPYHYRVSRFLSDTTSTQAKFLATDLEVL